MGSRSCLFSSFYQAGFECSTHRLRRGRRLDLIAASKHDEWLRQDYQRLQQCGIRTIREGLRWHQIESSPGVYDFSTVQPFVEESLRQGIQIIWDLMHFGWPDHVDPLGAQWEAQIERFAASFMRFLRSYLNSQEVWVCPINEISFLSWAGGEMGGLNPFRQRRGGELKRQLIRGGLAAARQIRFQFKGAKFLWRDPVIHIVGDSREAEEHRLGMFEVWDIIAGHREPELGGEGDLMDTIGVNFYPRNQWRHGGETITRDESDYRAFRDILSEVFERYRKPIVISETGTEGSSRPTWFAYISEEVAAAQKRGIPVEGICWYPILNHPGWDDNRHCHNGLWDYVDATGNRELFIPLARELQKRQLVRGESFLISAQDLETVPPDLVCLSHLRWDGVWQRPQHLMSRFANRQRVHFVEEPVFHEGAVAELTVRLCGRSGVFVVTPHLPETERANPAALMPKLLDDFFRSLAIRNPQLWFYTPMAVEWLAPRFQSALVVYDCMDELSQFRGAPSEMAIREQELFQMADVIFTGGRSLYEAKRKQHSNVYLFPSAVDTIHFAAAQTLPDDRPDQALIPLPRIGFAGVIDERMNLSLVSDLAALRPAYQFIFLGPVAKIDTVDLPVAENIHWLGQKHYEDLPSYFAGWSVAIMPFALNDATRYISPTKTPEYLAAGLPVVSTPIRDVVTPYGDLGLVQIADTAKEFAVTIDDLWKDGTSSEWKIQAKTYITDKSWDATWLAMQKLMKPVAASSVLELLNEQKARLTNA